MHCTCPGKISTPIRASHCLLRSGKMIKITCPGYTCVYVCAWSKVPHTHIYALQYAIELIYLSIVNTPVCA
jgi:hypothetical protein